jgi:prolipoprotein diacylglyceryl transferase
VQLTVQLTVQGSALAAIPPPPGRGIDLGPFTLRYYGLAIALGVLAGVWLARRRYTAVGGDAVVVDAVAGWTVAAGLVGARVGYVLPRLDRFATDPLGALAIWEGGLTFFGALAGGLVGAAWALRRRGVPLGLFVAVAAPAIPLAQAIGRWGNYFNQELYGRSTDLPWALEVEPAHRVAPYEAAERFHPAFLYESLWNLALVAVLLWADRRYELRRGGLFFVYLVGYGIGRFWIELLRVDTDFRLLGLSRNNLNALLIIAVGASGMWWAQRRSKEDDATVQDEWSPEHTSDACSGTPSQGYPIGVRTFDTTGQGSSPPRSERRGADTVEGEPASEETGHAELRDRR